MIPDICWGYYFPVKIEVEENDQRHLSVVAEDDDGNYDDYEETTTDPGNTLLIIAIFLCLALLAGVPLFVKLGRWCQSRKNEDGGDAVEGQDGWWRA